MTLAAFCVSLITTVAVAVADIPPPPPAPPSAPAPNATQAAYQETRAKAGRLPDDQVKLALWCEAHGLTSERLHHLTLAILADPNNATARGLMGLVLHEGRWLRPEILDEKLKADPQRQATLAEYQAKRVKAAYTSDAQYALGAWCEEHGLKEQAKAHLTAVTRLDPRREQAWKKLGYKRHDGRWVTEDQLAAEKAEADAQKLADKTWRVILDRYRLMLDRPANRVEAETALNEVTDPRAVPAILHAFARGGVADQLRAVQLLGQVDSPKSSRALASLAVFSKSAEVRRSALETLKRRDPRDFLRLWIALIRKPIQFEVKPVGGPGSPGTLLVEGDQANLRRIYSPPAMPDIAVPPGTRLSYDTNGLPVLTEPTGDVQTAGRIVWLPYYSIDTPQMIGAITQTARGNNFQQVLGNQAQSGRPAQTIAGYLPYAILNGELVPLDVAASQSTLRGNGRLDQEKTLRIPIGQMALEVEKSAQTAQQQLARDVADLETVNAAIRRANEPGLQALRAITGQDFGDDPIAWGRWWTDQEGYAFALAQTTVKPTIFQDVPLNYTPQTVPQIINAPVTPPRHSYCFATGTTVRTISGDRVIESIQAGDIVLVQDTVTGSLRYQGVVAVYHNPPNATLRINLVEGDPVVSTGIHRYWKAGKGWTMARELKPGDLLRTLGGVAKVESVDDDRIQPVFNLEVASGHSFLVGKLGVLVHDNSLVDASPNPFDAGTAQRSAVVRASR